MDEKILSLKNFGIIYKNKPKGKGFGRSAKDEELSKDYKLSNAISLVLQEAREAARAF